MLTPWWICEGNTGLVCFCGCLEFFFRIFNWKITVAKKQHNYLLKTSLLVITLKRFIFRGQCNPLPKLAYIYISYFIIPRKEVHQTCRCYWHICYTKSQYAGHRNAALREQIQNVQSQEVSWPQLQGLDAFKHPTTTHIRCLQFLDFKTLNFIFTWT